MTEVGFYPSRRLKKRESRLIAYPSQWPLVGVATLLLFMFMVIVGPPNVCSRSALDLANVRQPVPMPWANREDAIHVALMRDGTIYFQNRKITIGDLRERIRECTKAGAEPRAYLSVDARARYSDVKVVLDGVRDGGI